MARFKKIAGGLLAGAVAASTVVAAVPAANAATGNKSLVSVLTSDGNRFDSNKDDYDLVTEIAIEVLSKKPTSAVKVLADGTKPVTAFIPRDSAFRHLVWNLTGTWYSSESAVFNAAKTLGIPTLEKVLLYHVVPGATIDAATALKSNGAALTTAEGSTLTVHARPSRGIVQLVDKDPNAFNPVVVQADINKGNKQIAHGLNLVLRPLDLP